MRLDTGGAAPEEFWAFMRGMVAVLVISLAEHLQLGYALGCYLITLVIVARQFRKLFEYLRIRRGY